MSEDTAPIVVTLKAGTGYDSPWLVIRGSNPDEVVTKLRSLDGVIEATLEAAGAFAAGRTFGATAQSAPQAAPAPFEQQAAPQGPPPAWGQTPAAQQQGAAPAQQAPVRSKYAGQPHPEGKTCSICPNVLEKKKTQNGKDVWRCPEWRWAGGAVNGHSSEWID